MHQTSSRKGLSVFKYYKKNYLENKVFTSIINNEKEAELGSKESAFKKKKRPFIIIIIFLVISKLILLLRKY